ncbi:acyl-CoA dehydrogenase family protein [Amycolatopsis jejuensis]|uniref:acyl-CoA dehydrogenase family protein n=1 Tax=Amycolatopsis jejuensis TaxID=330084 RepID=UPI000AA680D3|nr:acyl-CoA dehydrogenase family protein [Amycolatopsis jejuensis]
MDELLEAAETLAAVAGAHAAETERLRALAPAVEAAARASGLLRTGLPRRLGGTEPPPAAALRAAERVAEADASAGWCVSIAATSSLNSAYVSPEGGAEVYGDPDAVAVGVWAQRGTMTEAGGGVTVTGRWPFCSGVSNADWIFLGGFLGGKPVVVAVRTAELEILGNWRTSGLCGTGSHDTTADDVFVPQRRVFSLLDGPPADAGPLHRFPVFGFFAASIAAAALGNARGAITELIELAGTKQPSGSSRLLAERSATHSAVAEAEASLRAAREFYYRAIDDAWQAAQESAEIPQRVKVDLRLASTYAAQVSANVARSMYDLGGGTAIFDDSPLQRRFRDAHTVTAHHQVGTAMYGLTGRLLLGRPTKTELL